MTPKSLGFYAVLAGFGAGQLLERWHPSSGTWIPVLVTLVGVLGTLAYAISTVGQGEGERPAADPDQERR
jgi:hypothetical protein